MKISSVPPHTRPVSYFGILIQIKVQGARPFRFHYFARRLPHLGLDAAAADRANNRSIVAHQHLGGLERRNGSAHIDDGRHRPAPSIFAKRTISS